MITFQLLTLATLVYSLPITSGWQNVERDGGHTQVITSSATRLDNLVEETSDNIVANRFDFDYVNSPDQQYYVTRSKWVVTDAQDFVNAYSWKQVFINPNYTSGVGIFDDYNYGYYLQGGFYFQQDDTPFGNYYGSYFEVTYNNDYIDCYSNVEFVFDLIAFDSDFVTSYQFVSRMFENHRLTPISTTHVYNYSLNALNELIADRGGYQNMTFIMSFTARIVPLESVQAYWREQGYSTGYETGYGEGYNYGFSLGNDSNDAWRNILGAIIDTPILYLRKFFGYEVFGVNIYGLMATLISLIVALSIFRLIRSIV